MPAGGSRRLPYSAYSHPLVVTLDLTGNLHAVATTLGTDALPLPPTVPTPIVAALRHYAAGTLILLRAYVNGALDAAQPRPPSGPSPLPV